MQEYKIILTWEAIYDVTDIADYIEEEFGQQRADRFQSDLKEQMQFCTEDIPYIKDLFRHLLFFIL